MKQLIAITEQTEITKAQLSDMIEFMNYNPVNRNIVPAIRRIPGRM